MNRLEQIRARHEQNERHIRDLGFRRSQLCKDRAYLLDLLDRVAALPDKWRDEEAAVGPVLTGTSCAHLLAKILNEEERQ